jgi:hypothetical protein
MSVSGVGSSATGAFTGLVSPTTNSSSAPTTFSGEVDTPAVQIAQAKAATASALFGSASSTKDVNSFTPTAAAYSLYLNPALLLSLQSWDGSATPGSLRVASDPATATSAAATTPAAPQFEFNPFDESSWYGDSNSSTVDASA